TMRRHISARHGLGRDEYLQRWGLRPDYPLTASAYSERRSTLAKALGLGRKPAARVNPADMAIAAPAPANAAENPTVSRASGLRQSCRSQGAASEAAVPTSAQQEAVFVSSCVAVGTELTARVHFARGTSPAISALATTICIAGTVSRRWMYRSDSCQGAVV